MLGIFTLIGISIVLLSVSTGIFGRFYNPVTLYGMPFMICTLLASAGLFGIYRPSETTLLVVSFSIVGFVVGAVVSIGLFTSNRFNNTKRFNDDITKKTTSTNQVMVALCIIATLLSFFYLSRTIPLLLAGQGLETIKFQYSNAEGATLFSTKELLLFQWVIIPIYHISFIVFSYDLSRMVLNKIALFFSIVGMAVIILVSGGRNSVFVFLVICMMGLFCSKNRKTIWILIKSLPLTVKVAAIVGVLVLIYITQERSLSTDAGVLENVFFYFAGAIRYLDYILANPDTFSIGDELFYGRAFLGFLINPIDILCSFIFGYDYQGTGTLVSTAASLYIPFSDDISGNALCTSIYPFIRDFGPVGVFIGPALYGFLSSFVWNKAFPKRGEGSFFWKCIWIYFAYCLVFSEWRYTLIFPTTGIAFFLIAIVFCGNRKKYLTCTVKRKDMHIDQD